MFAQITVTFWSGLGQNEGPWAQWIKGLAPKLGIGPSSMMLAQNTKDRDHRDTFTFTPIPHLKEKSRPHSSRL